MVMKVKLNKREAVLISVLAIAALIYAYLNFLVFPGYVRIAELNEELMQKKQIAADTEKAMKQLEDMDEFLERSKAELENIEKRIPSNVRLPELVVNIDSIIKDLGMDARLISIGEPDASNKEYEVIPVTVSLTGRYDSILDFIKYIENNERKFIIDSFTLSPAKRDEAVPFEISMRTFCMKVPGEDEMGEAEDYSFFMHNNGKSYPFFEGGKEAGNK